MTIRDWNEKQKTVYTYIIDLDERDYFSAHVENSNGKIVFSFSNENLVEDEDGNDVTEFGELWIVVDGFMKHTNDIRGLKSYLVSLKIMKESWYLERGN